MSTHHVSHLCSLSEELYQFRDAEKATGKLIALCLCRTLSSTADVKSRRPCIFLSMLFFNEMLRISQKARQGSFIYIAHFKQRQFFDLLYHCGAKYLHACEHVDDAIHTLRGLTVGGVNMQRSAAMCLQMQ